MTSPASTGVFMSMCLLFLDTFSRSMSKYSCRVNHDTDICVDTRIDEGCRNLLPSIQLRFLFPAFTNEFPIMIISVDFRTQRALENGFKRRILILFDALLARKFIRIYFCIPLDGIYPHIYISSIPFLNMHKNNR